MIYLINKECFELRPPVISTTLILSDLGYNLTVICSGINDYWKSELSNRNISVVVIPDSAHRTSRICKIIEYYQYSGKVLKTILNNGFSKESDLIWAIGGNTIVALCRILRKYKFILQIQEMHEYDTLFLKAFGRIINDAQAVFLNEYNRCAIYKVWFKMEKTPFVLPNKPYFLPNSQDLERLVDKYENMLDVFRRKKVILYQGIIHSERNMTVFIKSISEMGDEYRIVLLGKDRGLVSHYKSIAPNIIHYESLPAPDYLVFTYLAYMGIVTYDPYQLNTTFCAPNKIYEYASFGKPVLGNNIPGLQPIAKYHAGILVDENNGDAIKEAIREIDTNYAYYSEGASLFFKDTDNVKTIHNVLKSINVIGDNVK